MGGFGGLGGFFFSLSCYTPLNTHAKDRMMVRICCGSFLLSFIFDVEPLLHNELYKVRHSFLT